MVPTESGKGWMHPVDFRDATEVPDAEYPLIFTTGRSLYRRHGGKMTRSDRGLDEIHPEALVQVSPADAESRGIERGGRIRVSTRRGAVTCQAWIAKRVSPGTAYMSGHFAEAATNLLTIDALDSISRSPEYKICACRVEASPGAAVPDSASMWAAPA